MRYLVAVENSICTSLSKPLLKEIRRFDIRSEIVEVTAKKEKVLRSIKDFNPDLLIVIGSKKSKRLVKIANSRNVKSCYFYQSLLDSNPLAKASESNKHKVNFDVPLDSCREEGNLLADFIRQLETETGKNQAQGAIVSIVGAGINNSISKLQRVLSVKQSGINYQLIDISSNLERGIQKIKELNALIATDRFSSMLSVFANCPMVNVYRTSLLLKPQNRNSIVNQILGKEVVQSYSIKKVDAIAMEVDKILNDHQYSAGIMDDYQQLKSTIGTQPYARRMAQELIEWMEESA